MGATWAEEESGPVERKPLRRKPPPRRPAQHPIGDALRLRLAEELDHARRLLGAMGDELSSDVPVVARHGLALQSVDIVGQMLGHIASVIRSSDPAGAVDHIGMADLKDRLTGKSLD